MSHQEQYPSPDCETVLLLRLHRSQAAYFLPPGSEYPFRCGASVRINLRRCPNLTKVSNTKRFRPDVSLTNVLSFHPKKFRRLPLRTVHFDMDLNPAFPEFLYITLSFLYTGTPLQKDWSTSCQGKDPCTKQTCRAASYNNRTLFRCFSSSFGI